MPYVTSSDGTRIAFDRTGSGPALILVDGALCYRASGPSGPLAKILADKFTVYTYDRRGRGESGNTLPYSIDREIEDLAALIEEAGGSADVYGISSGAALSLEAANRGLSIRKLVLYEAPFIVDGTKEPLPPDFLSTLEAHIAGNRRGDAVKMFMKLVGVPSVFIGLMGLLPVWSKLKGVAHTLPYDITIVKVNQQGKPLARDRWNRVTVPTLVMDGGKSPEWMRNAMQALSEVLPNARLQTLPGQNHMVSPKVLSPALIQFLEGSAEIPLRQPPAIAPSNR